MADSGSNTFRIEAKFPNPELLLFSGISAKLTIPLYQVDAIYVSPSALAMDEEGNLVVERVLTTPGRMLLSELLPRIHNIKFDLINHTLNSKLTLHGSTICYL